MMLVLTLIAYLAPAALIRIFSRDPRVIAFGSEYLRIVSLNFISAGIVFTTSSVFQGIGNTLPPLFSSPDTADAFRCRHCSSHACLVLRSGKFGISLLGPSSSKCASISCCSGMSCGNDFDSANRKISFLRARPRRRFLAYFGCPIFSFCAALRLNRVE